MSIEFTCECGKKYRVGDEFAGRRVACKACRRPLVVPDPQVDFAQPPEGYELNDAPPEPASGSAVAEPRIPREQLVGAFGTMASNPAQSRLDVIHFLNCYRFGLIFNATCVVLGLLGGLLIHPAMFILAGAGVLLEIQDLNREQQKLRMGDVNPAVVIGQNPWRVAVLADLATGGGGRPAVLILNAPLARMTGGPPTLGMRLAAVLLYHGRPSADAWTNIDATLMPCATRDSSEIARVTASIPQRQWRNLESALAQLPDKKPGLYKLWLGTANTYVTGFAKFSLGTVVALAFCVLAIVVLFGRAKSAKNQQDDRETPVTRARRAPSRDPSVPRDPPFERSRPPAFSTPTGPVSGGSSRGPTTRSVRPSTRRSGATTLPAGEPPTSGDFKAGQSVQIYWGSSWFAGTILRVEPGGFRVHYEGWSASFDETVPADRLRHP
ncbi:MAG TPA: DUF3239 domain-containing protein [Humisphaera sp.]|jgi:hypothetical protein|nr:DUF3239 domain-containing protein [Humisphaera sp.]